MKGNEKLIVTAEAVATLRKQYGMDMYQDLETWRGWFLLNAARAAFPRWVFDERMELSQAVQAVIDEYDPEQVVELASGGSIHGLEWAANHPNGVYVETDMAPVVKWKREKIKKIREKLGLPDHGNHFIEPIDVLADDIYTVTQPYLTPGRRTLVVAEVLPFFFDDKGHDFLNRNVGIFLDEIGGGFYFSHDLHPEGFRGAGKGVKNWIFTAILRRSLGVNAHPHFRDPREMPGYFSRHGFQEFRSLTDVLGEDCRERYPLLTRETPLFPTYMVGR